MAPNKDQQGAKKATRLMHSLASPFPEPEWPQIPAEEQQTILELFCRLLEPIGHPRRNVQRSKGKREKRKKSKDEKSSTADQSRREPKPDIESYVTIGFNSTHRKLEELIQMNDPTTVFDSPLDPRPRSILAPTSDSNSQHDASSTKNIPTKRIIAVFVDRSSQPPIMIQHLPTMMAAAAKSLGTAHPIWLVTLPNGSEAKLRNAVAIPRIGLFGVGEDAPGSRPLLEYVKACIQPVKALSTDRLSSPVFMPLKVDTKLVEVQPSKSVRRQQDKAVSISAPSVDAVVMVDSEVGVEETRPRKKRK